MKQLVYSDQGQGFDMARIGDRIFGLNQKFHDSKDSKGVGLYLVHSYMVRLGGRISVESEPNKGAKFTIVFP
jgi:sensor histidine kinase regulating citrate/malate metabolism